MKRCRYGVLLVGMLVFTTGMADRLSVQLDPGVNLSVLVRQGDPHRDTRVRLMVNKAHCCGEMSVFRSMPLSDISNDVVHGFNLVGLQGLNESPGGLPTYQLSFDIQDSLSSQSFLHCDQELRNTKFVPGVDYVIHIHSLQDTNCDIKPVNGSV